MGLTQRSSQVTSSAKKQQSISSFFTKNVSSSKPPATLTPTSSHASISEDKCRTLNGESLFISSDGEDRAVSFARRSTSPKHALDGGDDDGEANGDVDASLPARKRLRRSNADGGSERNENAAHGSDSPVGQMLSSITANEAKVPKGRGHTSKYAFSSSPDHTNENNDEDDETKKRKEMLHKKFVKKLGRPDSIAEIKRRNWQIIEESADTPEDGEDADEETATRPSSEGKKGVAAKKGRSKLTPMVKQFLDIKRDHMDTILVVEVGYKFKFFGEDARIAAKELSIVCIPGKYRYDEHASEAHLDNFASASVPVHRLHVHVKRLVNAGHKVGIVRQLETAALKKAGDNRNAPFDRKLTNLYTKGTYIDDVEGSDGSLEGPSDGGVPATGYLLCITESNAKGWGTDEKVHIGMVAVQPATGDVIYDDFEDGFMRSELETRLLHLSPCEILIVGDLSKATDKLVQHLSGSKTNVFGDKVRLERLEKPKTMAAQGFSHVSNFYAGKMKVSNPADDEKATKFLENVLKLTEDVTICLSAMITHMSDYGLEHVFDLTKYFQSFSARSHMVLNGTSLTSLEIYQNQTDHSEKGSLFWTLDRTKTRFGHRLLRKWVGRPLLIKSELEDRIAAVEELKSGERTVKSDKIKHCTRPELLLALQTLQRAASEFLDVKAPTDAGFSSTTINNAIATLPTIAADVVAYLDRINLQAAKDDDKYAFFRDESESDDVTEHKLGIASVEHDLEAHRAVAASKIKKEKVDYVVVSGIEYLIEVDNTQIKRVPASWAKISGTKKVSRFHTPEVIRLIRERDQHKEALAAACDAAFGGLLNEIAAQYQSFRDCIQAIANLDCLLSLATVASQPEYVKPEYTDSTCVAVEQGRHPMVEQLLLDAYVPNDTFLTRDETRAMLITGPNMGGKSSYVRQVALIAIMGQIGSYVPAKSAKLGMLDGVFTRMGAFDNMMAGESTFMVELSETSDILKQATSRSLIILDELGRGTSTHDGVAIAQAVLDYIVREKKSLTLFITHYQNLSSLSKGFEHHELKNVHMKFEAGGEDGQEITFLYEVGAGVAHRSYGLNVARLANIPESVLQLAAVKSNELEEEAQEKGMENLSRYLQSLVESSKIDQLNQIVTGIEQL
ncbi:Mismatch repair protein msh3 [Pseudocyphellaria aurata]|nr:Mismatch repair protein msh3 [Pseudocyphellaria aurata]